MSAEDMLRGPLIVRQMGETMRATERLSGHGDVLDLLGLGFGPANLALAVAMEESEPKARTLSARFLEQKASFAWHPDMLLDDAELQITFFKDLVTLKNPRSRFSFLNYLRENDRLQRFVNLRSLFPTRVEFNDYFGWAARQLGHHVQYGVKVLDLEPVKHPQTGIVHAARVIAQEVATGRKVECVARNVVLGLGAQPVVPEGIDLARLPAFHSSQFLSQMRSRFPDRDAAIHIAVIGSGQSAAEIVAYVLDNYPRAKVTSIMRQVAFRQSDESQFVNEIFSSSFVDRVYQLPEQVRAELLGTYANTNYSAVDIELVEHIYRKDYLESINGKSRLALVPFSQVLGLKGIDRGIEVQYEDRSDSQRKAIACDGAVFATGFRWPRWHPILNRFRPWLLSTASGEPQIARSYRVQANSECSVGFYLQGYCEATHGLSDTLLSLLPFRASELIEDIASRTPRAVSHLGAGSDSNLGLR